MGWSGHVPVQERRLRNQPSSALLRVNDERAELGCALRGCDSGSGARGAGCAEERRRAHVRDLARCAAGLRSPVRALAAQAARTSVVVLTSATLPAVAGDSGTCVLTIDGAKQTPPRLFGRFLA